MKIKILFIIFLLFISLRALADAYVPEFDKMQTLRCDISEVIYNADNTVATRNNYFRIIRVDDENSKIYIQKEPVYKIKTIDSSLVEFKMQSMTDDFIIMSEISINRQTGQYSATSVIDYDNSFFENRVGKSTGVCKIID